MTVDAHLDALDTAGLIRLAQLEPEIEYLFRHALVQDATYESILKQDRRQLHRAVAQSLEAAYPDRGDEMAATLGHHYSEAGDLDQAVHYYTRAGDSAFRQYANCEAESHYGAALNLVVDDPATPRDTLLHLFERKGRAYELMGEAHEAAEVYQKMEHIGNTRGDQTIVLHALMAQALIRAIPSPAFDPPQALARAEKALALARDLVDRGAEARTNWIIALAHGYGTGDRTQAIDHGKQALAIARELGLTELIAFVQTDLSNIYGPALQIQESMEALTEAIASWRVMGNIPMLAFALNSLSQSQMMFGRYQEAVTTTREGLALSESIENGMGIGYASSQLAEALALQGFVGEALHVAESGIAHATALGAGIMAISGRIRVALFYSMIGACPQARTITIELLDELSSRAYSPITAINMLVHTARVMFFCGEIPGTEQFQEHIGETFSRSEDRASALFYLGTTRASLAAARGAYEESLAFLDDIVSMTHRIAAWGYFPEFALYRARVLRELKRNDEAYETLAEARAVGERTGMRLILWRVLAELAHMEATRGDEEKAVALQREARNIVQFIANGLDDPQLRAGFLAQPEVRALIRGGSTA